MANGNSNIWLFVVIGALAYFVIFGNPFAAEDTTPTQQPTGSSGTCNVEDVTFSPKMVQLGKAGTVITGNDGYFITTDNYGFVTAGSSVTLPTNKEIQVLFGENSTTYYTVVDTVNTDCQDPFIMSVSLPLADADPSVYVTNSDGDKNDAAEPQDMDADDEEEITLSLKASTDKYFGNMNADCKNVVVAEYDKTYVLSVSGREPAPVPGFFANTQAFYDGEDAWYMETVGDGEQVDLSMNIETTSSAPTGQNITLHIYDCDFDKNEDDLSIISGVQDEDQNKLSLVEQTHVVYLN